MGEYKPEKCVWSFFFFDDYSPFYNQSFKWIGNPRMIY